MIDLSDGLVVDLGHLCEASGCSAVVDELAVPRPPGVDIDTALRGGDDYELAFTIPAELAGALTPWRDPPATPIGVITEPGSPIRVRSAGRERALPGPAWEHDIPGPPEDDVPGSGPEDPPRRR
jgi:thiamine-monophosphate kinase